MFIYGLLVGVSVSLLTVVVTRIFSPKSEPLVEGKEYVVEIKIGRNYHAAIVNFKESNKRKKDAN